MARVRLGGPAPGRTASLLMAALLVAAAVAVFGRATGGAQERVAAPEAVTTVTLADRIGSMASGFGSVWIADADAKQIMRVDPGFYQVQNRIPVPGTALVKAGAGAVWVLSRPDNFLGTARLLRIDPDTNRVSGRASIRRPGGGGFRPFELEVVDGVPWVLGDRGALRIDPRTGAVAGFVPIELGADEPFPYFVVAARDGLWVLTRGERMVRYALPDGDRTAELPVRLPGAVALWPTPDGPVLFTRDGVVARADPDDGRIAWRRKLGTSVSGPPFLRDGSLWCLVFGGGAERLVEQDPATGDILSEVRLPEFGIAGYAAVGRQFWFGTSGGKLIVLER
jgi:streptogramin lyase